jgi:tetratricopeptide (TPR) repeat protein
MSMKTLALAVGLALGLGSVSLVVAPQTAFAQDKKEQLKVTNKVGVALKAAQEAIGKKQFDVADAKLKEAQAVEKKTPYDQFKIYEITAYMYAQQQKYTEVAGIYEKYLETPQYIPAEQASKLPKVIGQLYFNAKNYAKAEDYTRRWLKDNPGDTESWQLLSQTHYVNKDYKQCKDAAASAISAAEKAGSAPKELWLQLTQTCSMQLDDQAGVVAAYEKLVRYYPKTDYWERLLDRAARNERNDRVMLGIYRLQGDVGALKRPDQYMEYAQIAADQAMPGEGLKVVQTGFEKKVLGVDAKDKERHERLLTAMKEKADADRKQLPQYEKEAQASTAATGQLDAGLGLAYFSYDMYDQAIQALDKGLKKGGLKNPDEYRIALGISYLRKGQRDQARSAFKAVPADSPMAKVADLWELRSYN